MLLAVPKKAAMDSTPTQGARKTDALSIGLSTKAAANSGDPFLRTIAIQSSPGDLFDAFNPSAIRASPSALIAGTSQPSQKLTSVALRRQRQNCNHLGQPLRPGQLGIATHHSHFRARPPQET